MMDSKLVGSRILQRRIEIGLTQQQIAEAVGVATSTIKRYESGEFKKIKLPIIESIAKALKVNPDWICGKSNEKAFTPIPKDAIVPTGMVPILGVIPGGTPILAEENIEGYMPTMLNNPKEYFYLRVRGESMIGAGITTGDRVLIHKQKCAENGEIVACRVNGDDATLKRFRQMDKTVFLLPENPSMQPIIIPCADFDNGYAEILGVAKQVVKNL